MKVICIDNSDMGNGICNELIEGNIYQAVQSYHQTCYDILEMLIDPSDGKRASYLKIRFIPLSEIDETELINNKEEVTN